MNICGDVSMENWHKEFIRAQDYLSEVEGNEYFAEQYRFYEPWYSYPIIRMLAEESFEGKEIRTILDIGCGYGSMALYTQRMFAADVYCLDIEKRTIPHEKIHFKQMNIEFDEFPFRWPFYFDKIIMTELLEHLNCNPIHTLEKVRNRLKDDGFIYLSTPNACDPLWGRITKHYDHVGDMPFPEQGDKQFLTDEHIYQYSEGELRFIFNESGLEVEKMEKFKPPFWGEHFSFKLSKMEI